MAERLWTTYQIAELLGQPTEEVDDWVRKGWLPARRLPDGPVRVPEQGFIQFLRQRGVDLREILQRIVAREKQPSRAEQASAEIDAPTAAEREAVLAGVNAGIVDVEPEAQPADADKIQIRSGLEPVAPAKAEMETPARVSPASDRDVETQIPHASRGDATPPLPETSVYVPESSAAAGPEQAAQVAEAMLANALASRVEEIHIEPQAAGLILRLRIDGMLRDRTSFRTRLPEGLAPLLVSHLKSLAGLPAGASTLPQSKAFTLAVAGQEMDLRLAACPTRHGERLVVHFPKTRIASDQIGLIDADRSRLASLLATPGALVLVAGPARSGKATTVRALAETLTGAGRNIGVIEREFELDSAGLSESQAGGAATAEFVRAWRGQGADAIAITDLCDPSAAVEIMDALRDGVTVLACMTAPSAADAIGDLFAMGAERWQLGGMLRAIVEPRVVRVLCPSCRKQAEVQSQVASRIGLAHSASYPVYAPGACKSCAQTGYAGRTGVFGVTYVDGDVQRAVRAGEVGDAFAQRLREAGLELLRAGRTSAEELARVFRQ